MSDVPAALAALWGQVPPVACKGLCHEGCANIAASTAEREVIRQATGVRIPDPFADGRPTLTGTCPLLTPGNRCAAHDVRPLICRFWGAAQSLPCVHGCTPTFGVLPDAVARDLLAQASALPVPIEKETSKP